MKPGEIVIATKNEKKLHELKKYLKGIKARIRSLKDFEKTPRIVEDKATFRGNAAKKALIISRFTRGLVLADDSGLVVKALDGEPGVRSSRFAGPNKSDRQNNLKLLEALEGLAASKREARFVCAIAIADNGRIVKMIEEYCPGRIAFEPSGRHGFGYDPLFLIPEYNKTFGKLGPRVKDRMSHRSKALKKSRKFLNKYLAR